MNDGRAQKRTPAPPVPDPLRKAMERGDVVPFIGAGISMGADLDEGLRMPSYEALLRNIFAKADGSGRFSDKEENRETCLRLLEEGKLMNAADILDQVLSERDLYLYLRSELNHLQPRPSLTHELLNLLNFRIVLTSNYDRILESSFFPTPEVVTYRDKTSIPILMEERKPFIFKIHGDLTRPETIVLGWSRYEELHLSNNKEYDALRFFFKSLLQNKTLLFLGCSMKNSEYSQYFADLAEMFGVQPGPHYALVEKGALTVDEKTHWYKRLGVDILEFERDENYSQVWEFIASLRPQRRPEDVPLPGKPWENFYVLDERPDYLQLQLDREIKAQSCRYLTPNLTNALTHEEYIRIHCDKELEKFRDFVADFESFKRRTLEIMLKRASNLRELIEGGRIEVRAVFLQDSIEQELHEVGEPALDRFKYVLSLAKKYPGTLGLRAYAGPMSRTVFMKSTYALVFSDNQFPDIAWFYAPQATTNKFKTHMVQVNTRPVMERVEHFERLWVASLREGETIGLLESKTGR
jgi:hypothetical protein